MKITWNENPMATKVELDEREQAEFKLKIRLHVLEERFCEAHFDIDERHINFRNKHTQSGFTLEQGLADAREALNLQWLFDEGEYKDKGLTARTEELFAYYLNELSSEHIGDCTCVPASCCKCAAERFLDFDTIKGVNKSMGHKISSTFSYRDGEEWKTRTGREVLKMLRTYDPKFDPNGSWGSVGEERFNSYIPKWKEEAKKSYDWLVEYYRSHPELTGLLSDEPV